MTAPFITVAVGPRNATTDPETGLRTYRWGDRDLPSVTTIRRLAGVPHRLHQWQLTQVIDYAVDHWPSLGEKLAAGAEGLASVRKELRQAATAERDLAAKLGTAVHDAAAMRRAITEVPAEIRPRLRMYLDWLEESRAEIVAAEFQVWNLTVGYAGTADFIARFPDGSLWLVDLKTGKSVFAEHALQVMAYTMAEFVGEDSTINEDLTVLLHAVRGIAVLHVGDRSWEFRKIKADGPTWAAFRGLLTFAVWMQDHQSPDSVSVATRKGPR